MRDISQLCDPSQLVYQSHPVQGEVISYQQCPDCLRFLGFTLGDLEPDGLSVFSTPTLVSLPPQLPDQFDPEEQLGRLGQYLGPPGRRRQDGHPELFHGEGEGPTALEEESVLRQDRHQLAVGREASELQQRNIL